jgi:chemotaxis protein CheD
MSKQSKRLVLVKYKDIRALISNTPGKRTQVIACSNRDGCTTYKNCSDYCDVLITANEYILGGRKSENVYEFLDEVVVGIGEYYVGENALIKTIGLGSCVGVALFDAKRRIGGLAHVMLPGGSDNGKAKYADVAIKKMLDEMEKIGANKSRIVAKLAGGAQIFKHMTLDVLRIGERNIISVEENLRREGIEIMGRDTGGGVGRSVFFSTVDGSFLVRFSTGEEKWL